MPTHASTEKHTYSRAHTHTHTQCEVIEAFIQMVMSWGTGLPEELLFLVRENREDWALHGLSLSSSSSLLVIQPPLSSPSLFAIHLSSHSASSAPLNQWPHFCCCWNPLLLLLYPHIPSYFHLFVSLSVRIQWTKLSPEERRLPCRRMDGLQPLK